MGTKPRPASSAPTVDEDVNDETAAAAIARAETAFSASRLATARLAASEAVVAARKASSAVKVRAFVILGKVELASQEFAAAERTFDRALAIAPNDPVARKGKERAKDAAAKADHP
jgi:Flp pilus assembly protein TadD